MQKAMECLRMHDIWQHAVSASTNPMIEDPSRFPERHEVQFKHVVLRSLWGGPDEATGLYTFRVYIALGARFVKAGGGQDSNNVQKAEKNPVYARIEATYAAEYRADSNPGPEALKAFALRNASFHVWPYWREFLASQCARMNLPKVNLPLQAVGGRKPGR